MNCENCKVKLVKRTSRFGDFLCCPNPCGLPTISLGRNAYDPNKAKQKIKHSRKKPYKRDYNQVEIPNEY